MINLFDNISEKNKEKLLKIVEANTVKYNKNVNVKSGINPTNYIAIIEYGCLDIVINDYYGNNIIIDELYANDIYGNMISNINSDDCSIITKEETKITYIDYDGINSSEIVKNDFYIIFMRNLLNILTTQVSNKNERIQVLTKRTTRDKLLEYFNVAGKGSKKFTIPFTFTELANYLCVDRCAMTRELSHLKKEGFIKISNRQVTLLY